MPTIGIIDDREDQRESIQTIFNLCAPDDNRWSFLAIEPLESIEDYPSWIVDNDVAGIVLDERLHEEVTSSGQHVDYNGHELAEHIRQGMETFPIFVVTSFQDQDLFDRQNIVENIIERTEFSGKNRQTHVDRILRAGIRFSEYFAKELSIISELANKVATGKANDKDKEELRVKQTSIKLAFPVSELTDRDDWINTLNSEIEEFDGLRVRLEKYLADKE